MSISKLIYGAVRSAIIADYENNPDRFWTYDGLVKEVGVTKPSIAEAINIMDINGEIATLNSKPIKFKYIPNHDNIVFLGGIPAVIVHKEVSSFEFKPDVLDLADTVLADYNQPQTLHRHKELRKSPLKRYNFVESIIDYLYANDSKESFVDTYKVLAHIAESIRVKVEANELDIDAISKRAKS